MGAGGDSAVCVCVRWVGAGMGVAGGVAREWAGAREWIDRRTEGKGGRRVDKVKQGK